MSDEVPRGDEDTDDDWVDWSEVDGKYFGYIVYVMQGDPAESIGLIRELADQAPDENHLIALGSGLLDTYIHQHAPECFPYLEAALRRSSKLRQAWSNSWAVVPDDWQRRFDAAGDDATP